MSTTTRTTAIAPRLAALAALAREAAERYGDDSVATGVLMMRARQRLGVELPRRAAYELIRRVRGQVR